MLKKVFQRAGAVAIGTGIGQGLVVMATPLLARKYSPSEYGTLALLMTVSNVSLAVACLRFDLALPSSDDADVGGLLRASAVASVLFGAVAGLSVVLLRGTFISTRAGELMDHPVLLGCCVALAGLFQATISWLLRRSRYTGVAAMRLSQGATFSTIAFVPGIGLIWAHVVSFAGAAYGLRLALRQRRSADAGWMNAAVKYRKFPLYSLPGAVLDVVGYSICVWVIAAFYGRGAAGEYSQVQRLIGAPLMLMSMSLGQILLKHTAELVDDPVQLRAMLLRLLRSMLLATAVALIVLAFYGQDLLSRILGPRWHIARDTVLSLGVAVFARGCVSPLSTVLLTLRRFGLTLSWQAAYFCSAALLMPRVAGHVPFRQFVQFYAMHETVFYSAYLYLILWAIRNERCVESLAS